MLTVSREQLVFERKQMDSTRKEVQEELRNLAEELVEARRNKKTTALLEEKQRELIRSAFNIERENLVHAVQLDLVKHGVKPPKGIKLSREQTALFLELMKKNK